ncbi:hypothetical protein KR51_00037370 [Rubidibacter lacunae KORDI 51-2]|uniref:Uncharacterized protein n=1 Tax=Rubidibacter lacunae KORDI 51-2 TaxID=582515 RepID=U5DDW7_9CHRO|nr:hypothetical protein KR51_00037370 [Rubidibacter lacunae KORDI 51-2]
MRLSPLPNKNVDIRVSLIELEIFRNSFGEARNYLKGEEYLDETRRYNPGEFHELQVKLDSASRDIQLSGFVELRLNERELEMLHTSLNMTRSITHNSDGSEFGKHTKQNESKVKEIMSLTRNFLYTKPLEGDTRFKVDSILREVILKNIDFLGVSIPRPCKIRGESYLEFKQGTLNFLFLSQSHSKTRSLMQIFLVDEQRKIALKTAVQTISLYLLSELYAYLIVFARASAGLETVEQYGFVIKNVMSGLRSFRMEAFPILAENKKNALDVHLEIEGMFSPGSENETTLLELQERFELEVIYQFCSKIQEYLRKVGGAVE